MLRSLIWLLGTSSVEKNFKHGENILNMANDYWLMITLWDVTVVNVLYPAQVLTQDVAIPQQTKGQLNRGLWAPRFCTWELCLQGILTAWSIHQGPAARGKLCYARPPPSFCTPFPTQTHVKKSPHMQNVSFQVPACIIESLYFQGALTWASFLAWSSHLSNL